VGSLGARPGGGRDRGRAESVAGPPPSWAAIQTDLEARLAYANLDVLFSDGGPGIEESLRHPGMAHQRCQWHGRRSFPSLLYADGFKKPEQGPLVAQRQAIPALARTRAQLEPLRPEDRPAVDQMLAKNSAGRPRALAGAEPRTLSPGPELHPESDGAGDHVPPLVAPDRGSHPPHDQCDRVGLQSGVQPHQARGQAVG